MKLHHRLTSAFFILQLAACNRPPGSEGEDLVEEGVPPISPVVEPI